MRARRTAALTAALGLSLTLAGCAPAAESFVTISYTVDGAEQSLTMKPKSVRCDDTSVSGVDSTSKPVGMFTFIRARGGEARLGTAAITDGDRVFSIRIKALDLDTSDDGTVTVAETDGDVSISPNSASTGEAPDPASAVEVEGTLSAELHCSK